MSTFSGKVLEIDRISIDRFDGNNLESSAYFLSHCHTDHMQGICNKLFIDRLAKNPEIYLYCSPITAAILKNGCLSSVANKIIGLSIGPENLVAVPLKFNNVYHLIVSLVPAGHCPGSVMFLFEENNGTVLYTGDFRIMPSDWRKMTQLHGSNGQVKLFSKVYLDTTFLGLHPQYSSFPSRYESATEVCKLIREWLSIRKENVVHLHTSARYGSEYLFAEIAKALKMPVHVSAENYQLYRTIPEIDWAVTNDPRVRIHACMQTKKNGQSSVCSNVPSANVKVIKPAALWWFHQPTKRLTLSTEERYQKVMYSCHSSPTEIKAMLKYLKPLNIEPCVIPDGWSYEKINNLCQSLLKECCQYSYTTTFKSPTSPLVQTESLHSFIPSSILLQPSSEMWSSSPTAGSMYDESPTSSPVYQVPDTSPPLKRKRST